MDVSQLRELQHRINDKQGNGSDKLPAPSVHPGRRIGIETRRPPLSSSFRPRHGAVFNGLDLGSVAAKVRCNVASEHDEVDHALFGVGPEQPAVRLREEVLER